MTHEALSASDLEPNCTYNAKYPFFETLSWSLEKKNNIYEIIYIWYTLFPFFYVYSGRQVGFLMKTNFCKSSSKSDHENVSPEHLLKKIYRYNY